MSSDEYSYPELDQVYADSYLFSLIKYLESKGEDTIVSLLKDSECRIETTSDFARRGRWNAYSMRVYFYIPIDKFVKLDRSEAGKLRGYCNIMVDRAFGYDVTQCEIIPKPRTETSTVEIMSREIARIQNLAQETLSRNILPDEILEKGRQMTHIYLYFYCIENSLRNFIEDVGKEKLGPDYFNKLKLNTNISSKIKTRKENESKKTWMRLRGGSDIYYMDFSELSNIIQNNWGIFKDYFDSMQWITTRIDELSDLRNQIAHNSYLGEDEQEMIRSHYKSILRKLGVLERST